MRDLFALSEDAAGGAGQSRSRTTCRFRSTSAARSAAGNSCSSTASRSSPIRPRTRRGIAAPIWSTAPATAPNAIRRATCSAASSRASASPAARTPDGDGFVPEHHAEGLEHVARADSSSCSRPARRRTATPSAARWARSSPTPRKLSAEDRAAIATYVKSLPPVEGPKPAGTEIARLIRDAPRAAGHRVFGRQPMNLLKAFLLKALSALLFALLVGLRALSRRAVGAARPGGVLPRRLRHRAGAADLRLAARACRRRPHRASVRPFRAAARSAWPACSSTSRRWRGCRWSTSTAISFAAPLITVAFAAWFLGERVRIYRWSAVAVGFAGIIVMLWPYLDLAQYAAGGSATVGRHRRRDLRADRAPSPTPAR